MIEQVVDGKRLLDVRKIECIELAESFRIFKRVGAIRIDAEFNRSAGSVAGGANEIDVTTRSNFDLDTPIALCHTSRDFRGKCFRRFQQPNGNSGRHDRQGPRRMRCKELRKRCRVPAALRIEQREFDRCFGHVMAEDVDKVRRKIGRGDGAFGGE